MCYILKNIFETANRFKPMREPAEALQALYNGKIRLRSLHEGWQVCLSECCYGDRTWPKIRENTL